MPTVHGVEAERAARSGHARRLALVGLVANIGLSVIKLLAGVLGNSYALVADAVESLIDIFGSMVIWVGLRVSAKPRTERHPYGYGRAESLAAVVVAGLLFAASIGIAIEAIREIITPNRTPKWWTLVVLVAAILVKLALYGRVKRAAAATGSAAVETDAWHHWTDAMTSAAAFVGISIAVIGGKGWEPADDWAALFASAIIFYNATRLTVRPVRELLDVSSDNVVQQATEIASAVPGVASVHKVFSRTSGTRHFIDMHAQVDPSMTVHDAHAVSHRIKDAIRAQLPGVFDVLIHIEPAEEHELPQERLS